MSIKFKILLWVMIVSTATTIFCQKAPKLRVATFNILELSTAKLTDTDEEGVGQHAQVRAAAAIIQKVRPDILVLNEIDHDYAFPHDLAKNARLFRDAYLKHGEHPIEYPYVFAAPCNTGIPVGMDLDNDGVTADSRDMHTRLYGVDCYGYGEYPGQYSMALLSKFPIDSSNVRTFQKFLWRDLPGHHMPVDFYSQEEIDVFRLSSKSHWDVPVVINGASLHLFVSHPTPPAFDGPEDRNGRRNFDEIKFWVHYIENDSALYDDDGNEGGFAVNAPFIIAGDLNAAPDGEVVYENQTAISQLLKHPDIRETNEFTFRQNMQETVPLEKRFETAEFSGGRQMRIDYVLPSTSLTLVGGGVYWPFEESDPAGFELAEKASDHRLVWIDIVI